MAQAKNLQTEQSASNQSAIQNKLHIESGDHTSMQVDVDGYCVTLRFSPAPAPDIWQKIREILLANIPLDISANARNNSSGREPACTLKTEDFHTKILTRKESEDK